MYLHVSMSQSNVTIVSVIKLINVVIHIYDIKTGLCFNPRDTSP